VRTPPTITYLEARMFNPAIQTLTAPPVSIVQDWRASYDGGHGDLIDMSQAVPGYAAHPDILKALEAASGTLAATRYGPVEGDSDLRTLYAAHVGALYGAKIDMTEIQITSGCNQAFVAAALAIAGHGDDILMTRPCYFNHESALGMLGIGMRYVDCHGSNNMLPTLADIDEAIGPKTRAIALVSPNNPCGVIYPADLLDDILGLCKQRGIWLILDETYRDFLPLDIDKPHNLLANENWRDNLIQLYSFSKSYCMPGHRLGAILASQELLVQIAKIIDNIQICAPRAAQLALIETISSLGEWRASNRERIAARSAVFTATIDKMDGWELMSAGAYFGYVKHPYKGRASLDLAKDMARKSGILVIPGIFFGAVQDDYLRFAFANAGRDIITQLPDRIGYL